MGDAFRLLGAAAIGLIGAVAPGCSAISLMPSLDEQLHANLAHMVEDAQDDLWGDRDALASDPEAALSQIDYISDARPLFDDPSAVLGEGTYTLLSVSESPEGSTMTLATSAGASGGGGFFYQDRQAAVCFTLRIPIGERAIYTDPSDCTDGHGHGLADVPEYARYGDPIPLEELDVRRTVTADDFQPLPCQCGSGGSCNCPGG